MPRVWDVCARDSRNGGPDEACEVLNYPDLDC
jgi:hypothetical protein